jgi:hypothetical protein
VVGKFTKRVEIASAYIHDQVTIYDVALIIYGNAAIGISIKGKAAIKEIASNMVL